jgi:hypothetical protein
MTIHQNDTYILMACISKDNNGKTLKSRDKLCPLDHPYWSPIRHCITFSKMVYHENDKISNGYQCYDASVFQGIQAAKERKGNHNKPSRISNKNVPNTTGRNLHEASNPEMSIDKKRYRICTLIEPSNNTRHKVSDNNQVAYAHAKAFDSNGGIENNRRIWICDL